MRSAQKSNRSRGRGSRKGNGTNVNRVYESTGPEGKVRGTPQQIYDKYIMLARDAQTSGDRVTAENFLQHAEHYQRILIQAMVAHQERREAMNGESSPGGTESQAAAGSSEQPPVGPAPARSAHPAPSDPQPVGGMTTIDAGDDAETKDLLVTTENVPASQPRRRRGNGRTKAESGNVENKPARDPDTQSE